MTNVNIEILQRCKKLRYTKSTLRSQRETKMLKNASENVSKVIKSFKQFVAQSNEQTDAPILKKLC